MGGNKHGKSGHLYIFTSLKHLLMLVRCIFTPYHISQTGMLGHPVQKWQQWIFLDIWILFYLATIKESKMLISKQPGDQRL